MEPIRSASVVSAGVMQCVLAAALAERDEDPLAALFAQSVPALTRSIGNDRLLGRSASWATSHAQGGAQRLYADMFARYEAYLAEEERLDAAALLVEASKQADAFREERHLGLLLVCAETPLLPEQVDLFERLSRNVSRGVLGSADGEWPSSCAGRMLVDWPRSHVEPQPQPDRPTILQAATRREEVLAVLSAVASSNVPVSEVELAVTGDPSYPSLIQAVCRRLGVPVSLDEPDDEFRFTGFVRDFLEWLAQGEDADRLPALLRSGCLQTQHDACDLASVMDEFRVSTSMLEQPGLRDALLEGAKRKRIDFERVDAMLDFLHAMRRHRWPRLIRPANGVERLEASLEALLTEDIRGARGARGSELLEELLDDFRRAPDVRVPSSWLASRMMDLLDAHRASWRDQGTGILVSRMEDAGFGPRSRVWVLGLDDKSAGLAESNQEYHFAGLDAEEPAPPVLVRHRLSELSRRRGDGLTLCVPSYDVPEGRSLFPSSALIEQGGVKELDPVKRTTAVDVADAFRGRSGGESFPWVSAGQEAMRKRRSNQWTEMDGRIRPVPAGEKVHVRTSTSRMEVLAACPFRYWLSEVLRVPVAPEQDGEWITPSDTGSILHDLFEQHTLERIAGSAGTDVEDEKRMLAGLREALERHAARSGSGRQAAIVQQVTDLSHAVEQYFQRERQLEGKRWPVHAELSLYDPDDPDSRHVRFERSAGTVSMSGRIDRVDETAEGEWVIVDYKSGSWKEYVPARLKKLDSKLQWALYSLAAARLSGRTVQKAEYVFTSNRGAGWVSAAAPPPEEDILALLDDLLLRFREGAFIQAADSSGICKWCDFKAVCGDLDERKAQLKAKFEEGEEGIDDLFREWPSRS